MLKRKCGYETSMVPTIQVLALYLEYHGKTQEIHSSSGGGFSMTSVLLTTRALSACGQHSQ